MKWCQLIILPILAVTLAGILALVALSPPSPPEMKEAPTLPAPKQHLLDNVWNVEYKGVRRPDQSMKQVLCQLKTRARLRTVDGSEEPFSSLGWARLVPPLPLEQQHRRQEDQGSFKTCAVVASSGAMLHSGLGKEIDSHDEVMRFNDAPTEGYEEDVGSRTTIRLVNTMVLTQPEFKFNTSSLYKKNVTLVAWESAPYDLDLNEWYAVGRLFGPYEERRALDPGQPFYALHPSFVWQLWDVVQGNTWVDISPRPPTSGFMGILVMMALCDEVHAYEYIPSPRQTALCHYYDKSDYNINCTLGGRNEWHPVQFEKRLIRRINIGDEGDLGRGVVTLPGFSTVNNCDI